MKTQIDISRLNRYSEELYNINNQLDNNMQRIENLVLSLGSEWQGCAELAYVAKLLLVRKQFESLTDFINDYVYTLKSIAVDFEEVEKEIYNKIRS